MQRGSLNGRFNGTAGYSFARYPSSVGNLGSRKGEARDGSTNKVAPGALCLNYFSKNLRPMFLIFNDIGTGPRRNKERFFWGQELVVSPRVRLSEDIYYVWESPRPTVNDSSGDFLLFKWMTSERSRSWERMALRLRHRVQQHALDRLLSITYVQKYHLEMIDHIIICIM